MSQKYRTPLGVLTSIILLMFLGHDLQSKDWRQWRGPNRDGVALDFNAPTTWPDSLKQVWRVPVPPGISSPIVRDDRVFLLAREGDDEIVLCKNLDNGKTVWRQGYSSRFVPNPQAVRPRLFPKSRGKGPFATPVVHEDRIYTLGANRILTCLDTQTGDIKWQRHFFKEELPEKLVYECPPCGCSEDGKKFNQPGTCSACGMAFGVQGLDTSVKRIGNYYGAVSSPLITAGQGVVHVGNGEQSAMIAFDLQSGNEIWRWNGPAISSSSPIVAELHGSSQLITLTRVSVVGLSSTDGSLLWSHPLQSNAQIVTPVIFQDMIIFAAYRGPLQAISVHKKGNVWATEEVWKNTELTLETSSPVLVGNKLYGCFYSRKGQFACVDAKTGQTLWASEGRQGRGAALFAAGNKLIALTDEARLLVLDSSKDSYQPLVHYSVADSPTWAYPAIFDTNILLRDANNLTLWRVE